MDKVSMLVEIPEQLHDSIVAYVERSPQSIDEDRLVSMAIAHFLTISNDSFVRATASRVMCELILNQPEQPEQQKQQKQQLIGFDMFNLTRLSSGFAFDPKGQSSWMMPEDERFKIWIQTIFKNNTEALQSRVLKLANERHCNQSGMKEDTFDIAFDCNDGVAIAFFQTGPKYEPYYQFMQKAGSLIKSLYPSIG